VAPASSVLLASKSAGTTAPNPACVALAGEDGRKLVFWAVVGRKPSAADRGGRLGAQSRHPSVSFAAPEDYRCIRLYATCAGLCRQ